MSSWLLFVQIREKKKQVPIEDIGIIITDHPQIIFTQSVMVKVLANNAAFITCDTRHMPQGLLLNLDGNQLQSKIFRQQVDASAPLKKQLWQQTVSAKLYNQGKVLSRIGKDGSYLETMSDEVKSGDSNNLEARGAVYYWKNLFPFPNFERGREGLAPNDWLNYGYAILRATVARSLVGSGLLPTLGIFHRNQYNAYCLADDIMEPYRPYVDLLVWQMLDKHDPGNGLNIDVKRDLLTIPQLDVEINKKTSPLMVGLQSTTASLAKCFAGESRKLAYPILS